ncbi:hypothetical protein [Candidatus Allofournierella excrementavium]|uniref:hypothetical protein n=1 Tax=Candidatus Allofournierella excrementavium TaxID=2838591 RepID=UPI003AF1718A
MKRILSAALACAVLLAGCAAPASTSGAPGGTSAVSAPEPTPAPTPSPAPKEVSLEEWRAAMPANAPVFTFADAEPALNKDVLWPDQVELIVRAWQGTLEEADAAFGLPAGSFSELDDPDYPPPEGAMSTHAEGYVLTKTPVQQVTVDLPWVSNSYENTSTGTLPASLDEQAAGALAAARYFLYYHHGMHHGLEPSDYDNATDSYIVTEGAMYTRYSELEQFLGCVFTPGAYGEMMGGPLAAGEAPAPSLFYQGEGDTIRYMMGDRGGSITFCGAVFTEPVLQPDGSLLFWQLSLNLDDLDGNFQGWGEGVQHTPTLAFATPVRLVPSDNGWRVAEYSLPN